MAGFLDIKQGGKIRYNATIATGQTWSRGQFVVVNSSENLELLSTSNYANGGIIGGMALETVVSAATGNPKNDSNVAIAGQTGSVLLGEAVVVTDNLSGTGGWTPGTSTVYAAAATGNYTYTSTSGIKCGLALSSPASNGRLKFLFRPTV